MGVSAGAWAAGGRLRAGCQTNAWPIDPGSLPQLRHAIERIRAFGYEGFETSFRNVQPHFGKAAQVRAEFEKTGLRLLGVHIFLLEYDRETSLASWDLIADVAGGAAALGAERLILSGWAVRQEGRLDEAAARRKVSALNRAGQYCREKGIGLAYHNHDKEFAGDGAEIDFLLTNTDPALVHLMFDAGHAFAAGADAIGFFTRNVRRMDGVHLRDFRDGKQVPLGQGEFDLPRLAEAIRKSQWTGWLVNEEERPKDVRLGDAVVEPARRHLKRVFGV